MNIENTDNPENVNNMTSDIMTSDNMVFTENTENPNNIKIGDYNIDISNILNTSNKNTNYSKQSGGSLTQLSLPVGLVLLNNLYPSNNTIEDIYKKEYENEDSEVISESLYDKLFGLLSVSKPKKIHTRKINKKSKKNKTRKST